MLPHSDNSNGNPVQPDPKTSPHRPRRPRDTVRALWDLTDLRQMNPLHPIYMSNGLFCLQSMIRIMKVTSCAVMAG